MIGKVGFVAAVLLAFIVSALSVSAAAVFECTSEPTNVEAQISLNKEDNQVNAYVSFIVRSEVESGLPFSGKIIHQKLVEAEGSYKFTFYDGNGVVLAVKEFDVKCNGIVPEFFTINAEGWSAADAKLFDFDYTSTSGRKLSVAKAKVMELIVIKGPFVPSDTSLTTDKDVYFIDDIVTINATHAYTVSCVKGGGCAPNYTYLGPGEVKIANPAGAVERIDLNKVKPVKVESFPTADAHITRVVKTYSVTYAGTSIKGDYTVSYNNFAFTLTKKFSVIEPIVDFYVGSIKVKEVKSKIKGQRIYSVSVVVGNKAALGGDAVLSLDSDSDDVGREGSLKSQSFNLGPSSSVSKSFGVSYSAAGVYTLKAEIKATGKFIDSSPSNNVAYYTLAVKKP